MPAEAQPKVNPSSSFMQEMCDYITEAIAQDVEAAFHHREQHAPTPPAAPPRQRAPDEDQLYLQDRPSPAHSENSVLEEFEVDEQELSEDEGLTSDKPAFTGLFSPFPFKSLLHKARAVTKPGGARIAMKPSKEPQDPVNICSLSPRLHRIPSLPANCFWM